ncbi:hypothetical protein ACTXJ5_14525 [Psychrobacter alimentarius]|uniref:hypothetical protein n=1 Tax=Psychrobacter alimentarius TaxID=261164 RepID=UPI003FD153B7
MKFAKLTVIVTGNDGFFMPVFINALLKPVGSRFECMWLNNGDDDSHFLLLAD